MRRGKADNSLRFDDFYRGLYQDRWESLKASFLRQPSPVTLPGPLLRPYYMDSASILAAESLPVMQGDSVLDMCAAPGGKTLAIALKLKGTGALTANDRSSARRSRLHSVISECLPPDYRSNITVTGHDSSKWGLFEQDKYDAILLDAPCSSERHVITSPEAMAQWSPSRSKRLSIQQFAMLASALRAVKTGGFILYSTCSICPTENQDVVERLFARRPGCVEEMPLPESSEPSSEPLTHGCIVMPDSQDNCGPLFFCLIRRIK